MKHEIEINVVLRIEYDDRARKGTYHLDVLEDWEYVEGPIAEDHQKDWIEEVVEPIVEHIPGLNTGYEFEHSDSRWAVKELEA